MNYNNQVYPGITYNCEYRDTLLTVNNGSLYSDHTQLNKGHYFIEVMRPVNPLTLMLAPREITVQLTWANDIIEPTKTIPIRKVDFENNTIYVNKEFKEEIKAFKKAKFWQIEVLRLNIFVITAPKKPKIIFL